MFDEWLRFVWNSFLWWLPGADDNGKTSHGKGAGQSAANQETASAGTTQAQKAAQETTQAKEQTTSTRGAGSEAASRPETNAAGAAAGGSDDLTAIKGIGPTLAQKLRGQGIQSFADLVKADPEDLAAKLNQRPVTAKKVQDWIADAKSRMG